MSQEREESEDVSAGRVDRPGPQSRSGPGRCFTGRGGASREEGPQIDPGTGLQTILRYDDRA